jgi:ADP-ribose pyrophosphatase YjhB (NUDIX family)
MAEPDWLTWSRQLQGIAQSGLAFTRDPYDRERYDQIRALASDIMSHHSGTPADLIDALFADEKGYATPKVEVRAAVFDPGSRLLLVREVMDGNLWTLPGGWADVNITPAENVVKEVWEESGYRVRVSKVAAVWDRHRQGHPPSVFSSVKLTFLCGLVGGEPRTSLETSEVGWFADHEIPADLSRGRVLPHQIARLFEHHRHPDLPTDFD